MRYRNYIWDFDGTLFDSYPHVLAAMEVVNAEEGIDCDRLELWRHLLVNFGEGRRYAGLSPEAYKRFVEYQNRMGEDEIEPVVVPFEGAAEVLREIVERGGRNYLYTHRNRTSVGYLERYGLSGYFSDMITAEDGLPAKPAPDAVLRLIERNGLEPGECIMIGDRLIDGMAGINAGIAGALITAASDATKLLGGEYDAVALEKSLVPSVAEVTRETMEYVVGNIGEFWQQVGSED